MTWNHRSGGSWSSPTIKARKGGQWVSLGGGGGGSGGTSDGYLLTGDPPTRSTTVNESDYSSLQSALDSIGEGTRLVLDGGTYSGNWDWPTTSHITLDGNGSTLQRSTVSSQILRGEPDGSEFADSTGVSGSYSVGDEWIDVTDASGFDIGDIVLLLDMDQNHRDAFTSSSGTGDEGAGFFHQLSDVDLTNDQIRLDEGVVHDRPNYSLEAINVNWVAEDQRITNLTIDGQDPDLSDATNCVRMFRRKEFWYDNITGYDGTGMLWSVEGYQARVDSCDFNNTAEGTEKHKTINFQRGDHHDLVTNVTTDNYGHESITTGGGGSSTGFWGCRNFEVRNCDGLGGGEVAFDVHPGAQDARFIDSSASNSPFLRPRAHDITTENFEIVAPGTFPIRSHNNPDHLTFDVGHVHGQLGTGRIFRWDTDMSIDIDSFVFRDIYVEDEGNDLGGFFMLRNTGSGTSNVSLTVDHVAINDTWVDQTYFDNNAYLDGDINFDNTFTTPSDGTSPSQYFADNYGW